MVPLVGFLNWTGFGSVIAPGQVESQAMIPDMMALMIPLYGLCVQVESEAEL